VVGFFCGFEGNGIKHRVMHIVCLVVWGFFKQYGGHYLHHILLNQQCSLCICGVSKKITTLIEYNTIMNDNSHVKLVWAHLKMLDLNAPHTTTL
jgi:hypothetical protein